MLFYFSIFSFLIVTMPKAKKPFILVLIFIAYLHHYLFYWVDDLFEILIINYN